MIIDAPKEIGIDGQFNELLDEFIREADIKSLSREELLLGRPWESIVVAQLLLMSLLTLSTSLSLSTSLPSDCGTTLACASIFSCSARFISLTFS